jgi:hypothetical protein
VPLIVTELDQQRKRRASRRKARYRRVRQTDGTYATFYFFDVASEDFATDFTKAFQSAVNKARKENRRVIGTADVEPRQN